jgi:multiple sugar transport system substrate-binding protein
MGLGMSQEIDSNMVGRAICGRSAARAGRHEKIVLNSDATVAAVEYMSKLFKDTMTNEVFSWNAASNNQGLVAGKLSYIVNSISATAPRRARTGGRRRRLLRAGAQGSRDRDRRAARPVQLDRPEARQGADAAKEFLLHYTANYASATWASKLYDFCAWSKLTPNLDNWLDKDPFGSKPENKLAFLKDAIKWSTNMGHPGPANTASARCSARSSFPICTLARRAARSRRSRRCSTPRRRSDRSTTSGASRASSAGQES